MSSYDVAMDRDANRQVISSNEAFKVENTITFAAATTGSVATHTLFNVTGNVLVTVCGVVDTTLNSAGAPTISIGTAANTAAIIASTTAKNLADGDVWVDATDTRVGVGYLYSDGVSEVGVINDGADITYTIASATVTAGVIDFYCLWRPLSSDGKVTDGNGLAV